MAKLTIDEKIEKAREIISKEEAAIAASREKIKKAQDDLKKYQKEKDANFANEILAIVSQGVHLSNEERASILNQLRSVRPVISAEAEKTDDSENPEIQPVLPVAHSERIKVECFRSESHILSDSESDAD